MKEYIDEAIKASDDTEIIEVYNNEIDVEAEYTRAGIEKGKEEGYLAGTIDKTKEIALSFLKNGADINLIAKSTNLSIKELKELQNTI